jgi:hypothetical protein
MPDIQEELIRRAYLGNLYIGYQGSAPCGPVILTELEQDEEAENLEYLRDTLGAGRVFAKNDKIVWVAYDEEAIQVIISLMPYLRQAEKNREIYKRICWAGNLLNQWRRNHQN